ncbi:MAG: phage holin family protein [Verrucomicrobiota bacterium]
MQTPQAKQFQASINFPRLLQSWALIALGVLLAASTSSGVTYDSTGTLILVVLLLSFFNVIIRPILILFALPFVVLTLGLGLIVINALVVLLVEAIVPGFHLASFWSALWVAVVISIVSMLTNMLLGKSRVKVTVSQQGGPGQPPGKKPLPKDDDVIDI